MKTTEAKPPRPNVVGTFNGGDHAQVTACRERNPAPAEMPATENDTVRASHVSLPRGGEKPPNAKSEPTSAALSREVGSTDGLGGSD